MVAGRLKGVVPLPAGLAVVAEAAQVAAEVRPRLGGTAVAHRVLQVGVDLDLNTNTLRFHVHSWVDTNCKLNIKVYLENFTTYVNLP